MKMESRMKRYGARLIVSCVLLSAFVLGAPATARAQNSNEKLAKLLPNLYIDTTIIDIAALQAVFGPLTDQELTQVVTAGLTTPAAINVLLGSQVAAFPLGSSAGGFTWTFDPSLGTFDRVSDSFGPIFSERALTVGKGRFNLGFNYQRSTFDELQGLSLRDGEVKFYPGLTRGNTTAYFEEALDLKLSTDTFGVFGTYGLTKNLDIGIAVPIVHVDMEARLDYRVTASIGSSSSTTAVTRGTPSKDSATGIGDMVLRGKYNLWSRKGGGLAAGLDIRLPTADEEELLGVAGTQSKIYAAFSSANGKVSPHVNIGYTFSGQSSAGKNTSDTFVTGPPDEFSYAGGVDAALTPKLTIVGDITGRTLKDSGTLDIVASQFGSSLTQLSIDDNSSLNVVLGSVGVKYNVFGTNLISANFLFPLNNNGLTDHLTWLIGFERSFSLKK
jgi:Putative MetA-pathway of phenol degradation